MNAGRSENRLILLRRFAAWIVVLGAIVLLINYSLDVRKRLSREPDCVWDPVPNFGIVPYVARYCYLTKEAVVLRLYDAKEAELLAERMYFEQGMAKIFFTPRALVYNTSTGDAISLPPTILDRLRAKLP